MKNAIFYYYNITPYNMRQSKNEYNFECNGNYYLLQESNRSLEEVSELYNLAYYLSTQNVFLHQILLNNNNELITNINGKNYILMLKYNNNLNKVHFKDILSLNILINQNFNHIKRNNWRELWIRKIDNIEYQISENKYKYKYIKSCIDYFIGLSENAIQLLLNKPKVDLYLSFNRITKNMRISDLYNPLNIIIDSRVRIICEYLRELYINNDIDISYVMKVLKILNINRNEKYLFFTRLLFPSFYFCIYEQIILEGLEETKIENCTNYFERNNELIKYIYDIFYNEGIIPEIEWIKKM